MPAGALSPVLTLTLGSAFYRGSKDNDAFEVEGRNTSVAEYCRRFPRRAYLACAIDYRRLHEDPGPGVRFNNPCRRAATGRFKNRVGSARWRGWRQRDAAYLRHAGVVG